jgi:hypothetical protein
MRIRPPKVFATIVSAQGIGKGEVGGKERRHPQGGGEQVPPDRQAREEVGRSNNRQHIRGGGRSAALHPAREENGRSVLSKRRHPSGGGKRCRLIVGPGRRWAVRITGSTSGEEIGALPYIRPGRRTAGVFYLNGGTPREEVRGAA